MNNHLLSPDTQAILLLCAQLCEYSAHPLKPLNLDLNKQNRHNIRQAKLTLISATEP